MQNHIIVHYGELRLKGRNRIRFEEQLIANIKKKCGGKIEKLSSSLLCRNSKLENFKFISGISWYASCYKLSKDYNKLLEFCNNFDFRLCKNKKTFALRIKRSDKSYVYDSQQIAVKLGEVIRKKYDLSVDLNNPEINIYIEISDYIFVYYERIKGLGGLPSGINGKVLCLLSGGIDSPVAAIKAIKRGCRVDSLHIHTFSDNEFIRDTKIEGIINIINKYQNESKLYVLSNKIFDINLLSNNECSGYEMILFRKFIFLLAQMLAKENRYKAIVTGDNLGQVASQTLDNLDVVYNDIDIPIIHPLITYDKEEIIETAKQYGTYNLSIEKYKDCCSLISNSPKTKPDKIKLQKLIKNINLTSIVENSMKQISKFDYS